MEVFLEVWPQVAGILTLVATVVVSGHAVLYKRDPRAAVAWVVLIWLVPVFGALLYMLLGINRIRRHASRRRQKRPSVFESRLSQQGSVVVEASVASLSRFVDGVVDRERLAGSAVAPLRDGDEAYPAMIQAIASARQSVNMSTYIFDNDAAGCLFYDALARATQRGVKARVIIDSVGATYSFPNLIGKLRRAGVQVARFNRTWAPRLLRYANLRNHRKILVVDGSTGFTGGINVRAGHILSDHPRRPIQDLHFKITGPVVRHLQETFLDDWLFATGQRLVDDPFFPALEPAGSVVARGISDGPDQDLDKLRWTVLGALACAQHRVRIVTPYFLPGPALVVGLNTAALRGVDVEVLLPSNNNLQFVKWATDATLWQILERGVKVLRQKPPFDHSKLMLVDDAWALIGSANLDPRSLRLNFEFNLECYDRDLCQRLHRIIDDKQVGCQPMTLAQMDGRSFPVKIRDGIARLFTPYL